MSDFKDQADSAFSGQRHLIVSPLILHDDNQTDIERDGRSRALIGIHGMLSYQNPYDIDGKEIPILDVAENFGENRGYWGGNGVQVTIPSEFTAQNLSRALGDQIVVCEIVPGQLFCNGIPLTEDSKIYLQQPRYLN